MPGQRSMEPKRDQNTETHGIIMESVCPGFTGRNRQVMVASRRKNDFSVAPLLLRSMQEKEVQMGGVQPGHYTMI